MIQPTSVESFNFMGLPLEMQDRILNFLSIRDLKISARVSRHFNEMVLSTEVTYLEQDFTYSKAREIDKNREVTRFLGTKETIDIEAIREAAQKWPNTTHLEIIKTDNNEITVCGGFLQKIAELFPHLAGLTLDSRSLDDFEAFRAISPEDLKGFSDKSPNLAQLTLIDCTSITEADYTYTLQKCTKLRSICFNSNQISDHVIQVAMISLTHLSTAQFFSANISKNVVPHFSSNSDRLTDLLLHIVPSEDDDAIKDEDVASIISSQKRLRSVDLKSPEIGPLTTKALNRLPNLQERTIRETLL